MVEHVDIDEAVWGQAMCLSMFDSGANAAMIHMLWTLGRSAPFGRDIADGNSVWAASREWKGHLQEPDNGVVEGIRKCLHIKCGPVEQ